MDVKQKVLSTIKNYELLPNGAHIVLGLSGGPDSVCLFEVLCELQNTYNYIIHPVHVNHKIRPGDAERDQEFVEDICRKRGLECRTFVVDCNKLALEEGMTSEEAGRKARYGAFFAVAQELASEDPARKIAIAVAQNANDQAETILFRLLRGTGTDGLAGIAYKRYEKGIAVVRPLLDIQRDAIENYCMTRNLSPRIDHTNKEPIYTRNKIRLDLLPFLAERFNPNIIETLDRLGQNAALDKDYIWQQARKAYDELKARSPEGNAAAEADIPTLSQLHGAVRMRVYNLILAGIGLAENITEGQLNAIEKVRISKSPSAMCDLTEGYAVYKEYEKLRFCRKDAKKDSEAEYKMIFMSAEEYEAAGLDPSARPKEKSDVVAVGIFGLPENAKDAICIRKRRDGDVIAIRTAGEIRHKKLQDFFVDAKLAKNLRDEVDLLAYGSRILWVLPSPHFPKEQYRQKGRFSAEFRPNDGSETILTLEILRNL